MRLFILLSLLTFVSAHGANVRGQIDAQHTGVVKLYMHPGQCTGFVVQPGVIITANHCVRDLLAGSNLQIDVAFSNGRHSNFSIVDHGANEITDDWAILFGDTADSEPIVADIGPIKDYSFGYHLGYGGGAVVQQSSFIVINSIDRMLNLSAEIIPGDSGSPLMLGEYVVGIITRSAFPFPSALAVSIARPIKALQKLYKSITKERVVSP